MLLQDAQDGAMKEASIYFAISNCYCCFSWYNLVNNLKPRTEEEEHVRTRLAAYGHGKRETIKENPVLEACPTCFSSFNEHTGRNRQFSNDLRVL